MGHVRDWRSFDCEAFKAALLQLSPTRVSTTTAWLSIASIMSHFVPAPPSCRTGPSLWLALWSGMVSDWLSGHFLEYSSRNSFSNSKQHYSAVLGLGALLSSPA